jgi:hypothetical protein
MRDGNAVRMTAFFDGVAFDELLTACSAKARQKSVLNYARAGWSEVLGKRALRRMIST